MPEVFISYRQIDDAQRQRVRDFAEQLRGCGLEVVLDQFFLEKNPGGPPEGWPMWSSERASKTGRVVIIGTEAWFRCFEGKEQPGRGLGAAIEAAVLYDRIFKNAGLNEAIRIVLLDHADAKYISNLLERYHRFYVDRDFEMIIRWLGGSVSTPSPGSGGAPKTSIPHNLPRLQPFFGREEELKTIREALDPETRSWGTLIDGPGGIGKTSLAVRAAYDSAHSQFARIIFVSVKDRKMSEEGVQPVSDAIVPRFLEMLNEIARELGQPDISKAPEAQRIRLLLEALRPARALLILDNLEVIPKADRPQLFDFLNRLPQGCKAILTSRRRFGEDSELLTLEKLGQEAALATLADLSRHNKLLAQTSEAERIALYTQTGGKPLLLRWVAGQLGRGSVTTIDHALEFLRSCPPEEDPLEFVFGDLAREFTDEETKVLCALTFFTLPAEVKNIAINAGLQNEPVDVALRTLANRSLVTSDESRTIYALVPMVADFLRKSRREVVAEIGKRMEERAYTLITENGGEKHDLFPVIEAAWPSLAPALPLFVAGDNRRLQTVCDSLRFFLEFTGRWDEWRSLWQQAEAVALHWQDRDNAGRRAFQLGWLHHRRKEAVEIFNCADRAARLWQIDAQSDLNSPSHIKHRASVMLMRGLGYRGKRLHEESIKAFDEAHQLFLGLKPESIEVALCLNGIATAKRNAGRLDEAEGHLQEALSLARRIEFREGIASYTSGLARIAIDRGHWPKAEAYARESLPLSEALGREELVARASTRLALALVRQGKAAEARDFAQRAVNIYTRLRAPSLAGARATLAECDPGTPEI